MQQHYQYHLLVKCDHGPQITSVLLRSVSLGSRFESLTLNLMLQRTDAGVTKQRIIM